MESTKAENTPTTPTTSESTDNTLSQASSTFKSIRIESVPKTSLKSSQEKNFRKQVIDNIPAIAEIIDDIWPKKATVLIAKQKNYTNVYFVNDEPLFLQVKDKDEALVPHIKLLHKCKFSKFSIFHFFLNFKKFQNILKIILNNFNNF